MKCSLYLAAYSIAAVLFAGGCTTIKTSGMLEADPGRKQTAVDGVTFTLLVDGADFTAQARQYYPELFADDFTSVPVNITRNCSTKHTSVTDDFLLFLGSYVFSLIVPLPWDDSTRSCTAGIWVPGIDGWLPGKSFDYGRVDTWFFSLNPVYWLIMPFFDEEGDSTAEDQTLIENTVRAISVLEPAGLKDYQHYRRSRIRPVNIAGREYWSFITLDQSGKACSEGLQFDTASVRFFSARPGLLDTPLEQVVVARKEGTVWSTRTAYLRRLGLTGLTSVSVLLEGGRPARVVIKENVEPGVEELLYLEKDTDMDELRWNNTMLVEAKNTSLLKLLRQGSRAELAALITRVEKEVLSLSEKAQLADSQVQQIVVSGGDPKKFNELTVLYRQRMTILEAVLSGLKRAAVR